MNCLITPVSCPTVGVTRAPASARQSYPRRHVRLLVHVNPIRVATESIGCACIGWTVDPDKPFTGWRACGQTKHIYTKILGRNGWLRGQEKPTLLR